MELEEMLAQKKLEERRAEGRAAMLLKQFQLKFGAVPDGRRAPRSLGQRP